MKNPDNPSVEPSGNYLTSKTNDTILALFKVEVRAESLN